MVRAIALLISAITLSRPTIQKEEATRYAKILNEVASKHDFDPLLAVAMIHFESRWLPATASEDGEDFGLGQLRARFIGACKTDLDPVNAPSEACKAVKAQLLVGEWNLRQMGGIIGANKKMCAAKRGKNQPEFWIAGYQGLSQPERNKWCVPGPTTTRVLDYHKELQKQLLPQPKGLKGGAQKGAAKAPQAATKGAVVAKVTAAAKPSAAPAKPVAKAPAAAKGAAVAKVAAPVKPSVAPAKPVAKGPPVPSRAQTTSAPRRDR